MKHGIFRFLIACLTASLAFVAFPASAAGPDAPVVRQYAANFGDVAAQSLTLVDNGRFILRFGFVIGSSVGKIDWVGNWQQKGARLCLTPDPPELVLYARPVEGRDGGRGNMISLTFDDEKEKEYAAFAWSRSGELPERFLKMDLDAEFLPLPAQDGYLFVAHIPGTGDAPLDIQRYPLSPQQGYRLRYAGMPKGSGISSAEDARRMQDSFFLMLFAEFKQMSEAFLSSLSGDESENLRAAIEKHARGTPPYCGTLDTTRMKLENSPADIQWARMALEAAAPHHLDDEEMRPYTRMTGTPMQGHKPSLDSLLRCGKAVEKNREDWLERAWNCVP